MSSREDYEKALREIHGEMIDNFDLKKTIKKVVEGPDETKIVYFDDGNMCTFRRKPLDDYMGGDRTGIHEIEKTFYMADKVKAGWGEKGLQ
jgi:hypothetical protein